jgi:hypothetical protein
MKPIDELFAEIAREHLGIETLETRNRDSLDFHDVGVASVKAVLRAAYEAGRRAASEAPAEDATDLPVVILTVRGGCV